MAWQKIGSIRKSKKGSFYIKVDAPVSLKKDMILTVTNPRESIESRVNSGKLDAAKAEKLLKSIPEYIRYEIFLVTE